MGEPQADRPAFAPGYGILPADGGTGLLPWTRAAERLEASRNCWIGTTRPDGSPHAAPVWGVWVDGRLVFGTGPSSRKGMRPEVTDTHSWWTLEPRLACAWLEADFPGSATRYRFPGSARP